MGFPRWLLVAAFLSLPLLFSSALGAQEPGTPTPASPTPQQPQQPPPANPPAADSSSKHKHSHAHDFLIRGTVFSPDALAFPSVRLQIRRANEKKFRWNTYTDSRGEFAVRVPQGIQYEVVVDRKGFTEQKRTIDAGSGLSEDTVVFRLQQAGGKK